MAEPQEKSALTLNQKVVVWAQAQLGKRIGKGECWDLAESALKQAGAMTSKDLGPVEEDSDYVWGDAIQLKDIEPGDILQLRDHVVTTTTVIDYTFSDGSGAEETEEETAERGHHTSIVNSKPDASGVVKTLEQNVKPKGKVVQNKLLATRSTGPTVTKTVEQRMNPNTKKMETVEVTRTVTISVSGTIWAYRPKPK